MLKTIEGSVFSSLSKRWFIPLNKIPELEEKSVEFALELISETIPDTSNKRKERSDDGIRDLQLPAKKEFRSYKHLDLNKSDHTDVCLKVTVNPEDESLVMKLPLPRDLYFKLKASRELVWNKDSWSVTKDNIPSFKQLCSDLSIIIE